MNIIQEIKDEIKAAYREPTGRDLTILAVLFLVIPLAIGAFSVLVRGSQSGYYWVIAGVLLGLSRLIPPLFRLIYRAWICLSVILGYFISRAILTIVFVVVIIPTGLIMRLLGKDPMERKWDPNAPSYWVKKEPEQDTGIERYEKQF